MAKGKYPIGDMTARRAARKQRRVKRAEERQKAGKGPKKAPAVGAGASS
jgi:hypothetical protein